MPAGVVPADAAQGGASDDAPATSGAGGEAPMTRSGASLPTARTQPTRAVTTTLTALLDDVMISDPNGKVVRGWAFDSASDVSDEAQSASGKWARTAFSPVGTAAGAHDTFSDEDGGCLLNTAPFTASNQYYEVSVLFPGADYAKHHVTARVKLIAGGSTDSACPAQAELFVVSPVPPLYPMAVGKTVALQVGAWQALNLDVPEGTVSSEGNGSQANSARVDQLGLRITTYPCE